MSFKIFGDLLDLIRILDLHPANRKDVLELNQNFQNINYLVENNPNYVYLNRLKIYCADITKLIKIVKDVKI